VTDLDKTTDAQIVDMDKNLRESRVLDLPQILTRFAHIVTDTLSLDRVRFWIEYGNPPHLIVENLRNQRVYRIPVHPTGPETREDPTRFQPREIDELCLIHFSSGAGFGE
jgi:hypothetical protein